MKKLFLVLLGVALCVPAFAATTLSDQEMAGVYASGVEVELNTVEASDSAAAAQGNIGAIVGFGPISGVQVLNSNKALVVNLDGDAAAALQNNIGAIASLCGSVGGAQIINTNGALVLNTYEPGAPTATIEGRSIGVESDPVDILINDVIARSSAVAAQNNIGVIFGGSGVTQAQVVNSNCAVAVNMTNAVGQGILNLIAAHHSN